jgi:hydroxyethylthiazole kinase-like sugar kinase family protein
MKSRLSLANYLLPQPSTALLKGPAMETIKLDAEIEATNGLDHPDQNANAVQYGIASQFAALEPQRVGENLVGR